MITRKQIIKSVAIPKTATLELVKGEGYWYFVYDDQKNNIYETHSVMVFTLNQSSLDWWISEAEDFVKACTEDKTIPTYRTMSMRYLNHG